MTRMREAIITAVLNEGAWLTWSMGLGFLLVLALIARLRGAFGDRVAVLRAMNLFYGTMIGTMGSGHLLAVTIKVVQGTLVPSPWLMYPLGLVLAIPGWWLAARAWRLGDAADRFESRALALNTWLMVALLVLGLPNLPLAAPALLNLAYQQYGRRRFVGWTIAGVALAANLALFVGSLVFWASGQTFEQFRGME
jgi:hypothetical protein